MLLKLDAGGWQEGKFSLASYLKHMWFNRSTLKGPNTHTVLCLQCVLKANAVGRNDLLNQSGASHTMISDNGHIYGPETQSQMGQRQPIHFSFLLFKSCSQTAS